MTNIDIDGQQVSFGRIERRDDRDLDWPLLPRLISEGVLGLTGRKVWPCAYEALNQGVEGTCVGHGWKHWLLSEPLVQAGPGEDPTAVGIYDRCTEIDEWTANDPQNGVYDRTFGTSTRSGAKVMVERGLAKEYRHAQSVADMRDWVLGKGPVVIGCDWYTGMSYSAQYVGEFLVAKGTVVGGHCVCVVGCDTELTCPDCGSKGAFLIRNSWGPKWGPMRNGTGWICFTDMDKLIFQSNGDAMVALETALEEEEPEVPPTPEDVFRYPYQTVVPWGVAEAEGLLNLSMSKHELLYVIALKTEQQPTIANGYVSVVAETKLHDYWTLYGFLKLPNKDAILRDPTLTVLVQYIQAKHRSDWNV